MSNVSLLLTLASQKYPDLNTAEKLLIQSAESGRLAVLPELVQTAGPGVPPISDDATLIRAELFEWICTDKQATTLVNTRGIELSGGKIRGKIDLSYATIPFPMNLSRCLILGGIELKYSTVNQFSLSGCITGPIWAKWLTALKDVDLGTGFRAKGGVLLDRARIAGDLRCDGGTFINQHGTALSAHGSRIGGTVSLSGGYHAEGETNFALSVIDGSFVCSGGQFHNLKSKVENEKDAPAKALIANQINVAGSAFLRDGFEAWGEVQFIAAKIAADFDCNGAHFSNPGRKALSADRISIGSNGFFGRGFQLDGILRMPGANIEGDLDFDGAKFVATADSSAQLQTATIKKTFFWREVQIQDATKLFLDDVTVGTYRDGEKSWPKAGNLSLFGFKYGRISGASTAESRRQWLELQDSKNINLQPYQQLASVLQGAGQDAESKKVLIAKEKKRYQQGGSNRLTRIWSYVLRATIGYGYAPRRALYWSIGVVLLGSLLFWAGYRHSLFSPISDGVYKDAAFRNGQALPDGYQTFHPLIYSVDVFLPIVDLHQEGNWQPNPSKPCTLMARDYPCGAFLRVVLWVEIIIGWALTTLAVAGFSGLIRKD